MKGDTQEAKQPWPAMIFLKGQKERRSFRCSCGCNVFATKDDRFFTCNACGAKYEGWND